MALTEYVACLALTALFSLLLYHTFFHPLHHVPGPVLCRITSLWTYYHSYIGDECSKIHRLHEIYGPVVRIAPNEVVISDGAALAPIYSEKGGFLKAPCYSNFDIGGHATIFSALDPSHRAVRSKAVLSLFSMSNVRAGGDVIEGCIGKFVDRMKDEATRCRESKAKSERSTPCNVLNLSRRLALDTVSSYLFDSSYGGIDEGGDKMSASSFVDALVAVGRIFFLPNWAFLTLETLRQKFLAGREETASASKVDSFAQSLVDHCEPDNSTYQGRLKKTNITNAEIKIQCEDLIFAGTDSTGMNIATICWYLAKQPEVYAKLCREVAEADATSSDYNPQSLPYLDAVVREGLRIAMANPTRLPRVVPPSGLTFVADDGRSYYFPSGTLIGSQVYSLHVDPAIFPNPHAFKPERWLREPSPEMQRNFMAFGIGQRGCIARNLAMQELLLTTRAIAREGVLEGAKAVGDGIEILEWFNSKVKGERIDIVWE